jgi:hypothetical protein
MLRATDASQVFELEQVAQKISQNSASFSAGLFQISTTQFLPWHQSAVDGRRRGIPLQEMFDRHQSRCAAAPGSLGAWVTSAELGQAPCALSGD